MSKKLANAKGLYLEGIRDGKVREAVTKYTGDRYTQHSTGVADGIEGFVAFFEPFIERCKDRDIQIIRMIEDGQYVFAHVYQNINNGEAQWVTADFFDTDENDKIIEHWDVIQAYEEKTVSGRTMVDGPSTIEDLNKTAENKQIVQNFFDEVLIGGNFDKVTSYISTVQYDQHNPNVEDGLSGLGKHIQEMSDKGISSSYEKLHLLVGQGNFVATLSHTKVAEEDCCFIDIFRLKDGLIVEHWDVQEKILPKEEWGNSGKF
jgi:predicted SnoaL-like aldol condensation-catalyzing enzyme